MVNNGQPASLPVREWILLLLMAFVTLGLYYPATLAPFCLLDDEILVRDVLNNPSWSYLKQVFGPNQGDAYGGPYFRPLSTLVFFLVAKAVGLEPAPFHLFNVIIHLANGLLIYFLTRRVHSTHSASTWLGFTAAMLFLVHPVNVEAVAWVSGRPTLLSTFFILLSFSLHLRVERDSRDWRLWAGAFCYLLSLLTYELAAFMPLAFLYWDLDCDPGPNWRQAVKRNFRRWLPYGGALLVYMLYRLGRGLTDPGSNDDEGYLVVNFIDAFWANISSPFVGIGFYLKKLFWPWPLNFHIESVSPFERPVYLALGVAFPFVLAWLIWKRILVRFWAWWLMCGLLVALPITFHGFSWTGAAERYIYLSSIAFAGLGAVLFSMLTEAPPRTLRAIEVSVVAILFVFGASTVSRATLWQSNVSLLRDTWEKSPTSGRIASSYARALLAAGREQESVVLFNKAMELGYISDPARTLGDIEKGRKNYAAAEAYYFQALWPFTKLSTPGARPVANLGILDRRDPDIYMSLIDLHYRMAEADPARKSYHAERIIHFHEAACKLEPKNVYRRYLLAKAHLHFGNVERARKLFAEVSEAAPDTYYGKAAAKLARCEQPTVQAGN